MVFIKEKEYGESSIQHIEGPERIRRSPGIFLGSNDIEGCKHSFFEILSNSIDEAKSGYGDLIEVTRHLDGRISVRDYGRGVPLGWNEKAGRYNWDLVYCELFAGGKISGKENYDGRNLGVFGVGACVTQCCSEFFDVYSYYGGIEHHVHFEKGLSEKGLIEKPSEEQGTLQIWKPDVSVFLETDIPGEYFQETLKYQAVINKGITFMYIDEKEPERCGPFYYEKGIFDYIEEISKDGSLCSPVVIEERGKGKDREDRKEYEIQVSLCFSFHQEKSYAKYFHNSSPLEHEGSPDKGIKAGFVAAFDRFFRENNFYTKKEAKVSFADIEPNLMILSSSFSDSDMVSYENQTKKAIKNKFIREFFAKVVQEKLEIWFVESKLDAERVLKQVLINKRSKESAEKQRLAAKGKLNKSMDIITKSNKLLDCREKDPEKNEIFLTEGDSAAGACALGRDASFQAIMPVRGKMLNCQKTSIATALINQTITELFLTIGIRVKYDKQKKSISVDTSRIRYGKIIILTDADKDGSHIRTLLLIMFYRLCPELIRDGRIYICQSPLFEIQYKKKTFFAFDENEKEKILKGKDMGRIKIQRSKGLGENDPDMMWESTLNPETRRLTQVRLEDEQEAERFADILLGNNLSGRREYIEENGFLYMDGDMS